MCQHRRLLDLRGLPAAPPVATGRHPAGAGAPPEQRPRRALHARWRSTARTVEEHCTHAGRALHAGWPSTARRVAEHYTQGGRALHAGWPSTTRRVAEHCTQAGRALHAGGRTLHAGWPSTARRLAEHCTQAGRALHAGWPSTARRVAEHCTQAGRALHAGWPSTARRLAEHRMRSAVAVTSIDATPLIELIRYAFKCRPSPAVADFSRGRRRGDLSRPLLVSRCPRRQSRSHRSHDRLKSLVEPIGSTLNLGG